jgi:hypothetical protein
MHHKKRGLGDLRWERRKKYLLASRYKEQQINSTLIESSTLGGGHEQWDVDRFQHSSAKE